MSEDVKLDDYAKKIAANWGLGCPACHSGRIVIGIDVPTEFLVEPDDLRVWNDSYDYDWHDDSPARCLDCGHNSDVADFSLPERA